MAGTAILGDGVMDAQSASDDDEPPVYEKRSRVVEEDQEALALRLLQG